jgi:hypothetical protein
LSNINTRLAQGHASLKNAKHVFLTLGTAHAYVLLLNEGKEGERREGLVVANCHRLPAACFRRKLLGTKNTLERKEAMVCFGSEYVVAFPSSCLCRFMLSCCFV